MGDRSSTCSSDEENWRACVEYETKAVRIGDMKVLVYQMEELPVAASLFMLAEMEEKDSEISGKRLWSGSHTLAMYLHRNPSVVENQTILELGAGTGICSIVAKKLGARRCIATDGDEEVVALLQRNVEVNECEVDTFSLFWGDQASRTALLQHFGAEIMSSIDVILAGDVLYKAELVPLLFGTVALVFAANPRACFVLCHIPRADVTHERVMAHMESAGFQWEKVDLAPVMATENGDILSECPKEDVDRACIYLIRQAELEASVERR